LKSVSPRASFTWDTVPASLDILTLWKGEGGLYRYCNKQRRRRRDTDGEKRLKKGTWAEED
jgi:hypothetical protein